LPLQPVDTVVQRLGGTVSHRLGDPDRRVPGPAQPRAEVLLALALVHGLVISGCDALRLIWSGATNSITSPCKGEVGSPSARSRASSTRYGEPGGGQSRVHRPPPPPSP